MIVRGRLPFVALALLSLIAGLWTGLNRIGWDFYITPASAHHGAIMVGGFLGTLIALEKIIPLRRKLPFLIPMASAASVAGFVLGHVHWAMVLLVMASAGLFLVMAFYLTTQRSQIYLLMLLGAGAWFVGNFFMLTRHAYPTAFPWWVAFALMIIIAERIEIMRFLPVSRLQKGILVGLLILFPLGILFGFHGTGRYIAGGVLVAVSAWMLKFDLIGVTLFKKGLTRYVAVALLCGYVALLLAGVFFITLENIMAYDAVVHTFFIGFVFSMIFAHGPIILPGVLGILAKPFHPLLYLWLGILHLSWMIRIFGDLTLASNLRMAGGLLTAIAVVGYFATMGSLTFKRR